MTWGFVATAAATVVAGAVSADASRSAANKQADASKQAATTSANAQIQALQMVQQQEAPYTQAGQSALSQYMSLLGLGGASPGGGGISTTGASSGSGNNFMPLPGGSTGGGPGWSAGNKQMMGLGPQSAQPQASTSVQAPSQGGFDVSKLPGYQFQMDQGLNSIQNSAAARGGALSGNAMVGLQSYGQGLASTQFQNYMSQLAGIANMGQAAASNTANQGASLMSGAGASLASGIMGAGNAQSANTINQGNILSGLFNSPSLQSGLKSAFNSGSGGGVASSTDYANNGWIGP